MRNGYVLKLLENIERLVQEGQDVRPMIDAAKSQVEHNHDANQDDWDKLDGAVGGLDPSNRPDDAAVPFGEPDNARVIQGTGGNNQYVSGSEPGSPDNPIGYPGTDQDQDPPGEAPKTVPGQKVTKK